MLNICLTFDHELFLGENFVSEKEILIDPTEKITNVLKQHYVSATFFTDVCSVIRYREVGLSEFPDLMIAQWKDLINAGQDVQLHIHANWLRSDYRGGKWYFDSESYRIHHFQPPNFESNHGWTMISIIKEGKNLLEKVLQSVREDYKCIAYRAGGFCIQPEKELITCLSEQGIPIDSSIVPGVCSLDCINNYDFRNTPRNVLNWYISPFGGINRPAGEHDENRMFEIPVATAKRNPITWILRSDKYIDTEPHRGRFISSQLSSPGDPIKAREGIFKRFKDLLSYPVILSLDTYDARVLAMFIKQIIRKNNCRENDAYISVICHPKLVCDALLNNLERFICEIKDLNYVRFVNFDEVYAFIYED